MGGRMRGVGGTYDEGAQHAHGPGALDVGAVQRARHVTGVGHVDGIASDLCDMTRTTEGPGEQSGRGGGFIRPVLGGWVGGEGGRYLCSSAVLGDGLVHSLGRGVGRGLGVACAALGHGPDHPSPT